MALIGGVLDCFSLPVMEDYIVAGPSVPKHSNNNKNNKKRLSSNSTSRSNLQLSVLDILLCFVVKKRKKNVTLCVPHVVFFCSGEEEL